MRLEIPVGKYVMAVSGGVDSMVLLDIFAKQAKSQKLKAKSFKPSASSFQLVVAHFNHGIRPDAGKDEELVRETAERHHLPFEIGYGHLGPDASEDKARQARYAFLEKIRAKHQADAIITAHHQDDLLETAIINILRGTGRRGLTALAETSTVKRPLLAYSKKQVIKYAKENHLKWHEDPSNLDLKYLRNYVRAKIMPKLSDAQRRELLRSLTKLTRTNKAIDEEIATLSRLTEEKDGLNRQKFINLPLELAQEVLMHWLRINNLHQFDKKTIGRLAIAIKTGRPGTTHEVTRNIKLHLTKTHANLEQGV